MSCSKLKQMAMILSSPIDSSSSKTVPTTPENCPPPQNNQDTLLKFLQDNNSRNPQYQQQFKNQPFTNGTSSNYQDCSMDQNQNLTQNYPQRMNNNKNQFFTNKNWGSNTNQNKFTNYQQLNDSSVSHPMAPRQNTNNNFYPKKNNNNGFVHSSINQLQQSRVENQVGNHPNPPLSYHHPQQQIPFKDIDSCSEYSNNQQSDDPRMKQLPQQQQQYQQFNKREQFSKYQNERSSNFENNNNNNNANNYRYNNKRNIQGVDSYYGKDEEVKYGQMNNKHSDVNNCENMNNQRKNHFQQPSAPPMQGNQDQYIQGNDTYISMNQQKLQPSPMPLQNQPSSSNFPSSSTQQHTDNPQRLEQPSKQQVPSLPPSQEPPRTIKETNTTTEKKSRELSIDKDLLKSILNEVIDEKLETLREEMRSLFQNLSLNADQNNPNGKTSQCEKAFLQSDRLSDLHAEVVDLKNPDRQRTRSPNRLPITNLGEILVDGDKNESGKNKKKKDKQQHEQKAKQIIEQK